MEKIVAVNRAEQNETKNSLGDDAVEGRSLEVEGLARLADALLAYKARFWRDEKEKKT